MCPVDGNLGELLIDYSLVTARLSRLAARQTHDLNAIFTWDVLSDVQVLSPASTKSVCRFETPKGLWLRPGESVIPRYGGTLVISGIEVKVAAGWIAPFREQGRRYAFLADICPQQVMTLPLSGFGVFTVFDDGRISPARGHVSLEFQQQMTALGNLDALQRFASRIRLRRRRGRRPRDQHGDAEITETTQRNSLVSGG